MFNKYRYKKPIVLNRTKYSIVDDIKTSSIISMLKRNNVNKEYISTATPTTIVIEEV